MILNAKALEAGLQERLREAYNKVAHWPENRMRPGAVEELGLGFSDLLALRNLIPELLAYLSSLPQVGVSEEMEEALRLAEIGEYLYNARAYSYGDGQTEPREYGIEWQWQQSAPGEYGQGILLSEAARWHEQQAEDGFVTETSKLRAALSSQQEEAAPVDGDRLAELEAFHAEVWGWLVKRDLVSNQDVALDGEWRGFVELIEEHEAEIEACARRASPVPADSGEPAACPAPGPTDETYYTKGKDAEWFEGLSDKEFAWEATCLAQDLNDTGLGDDLDRWCPFQAVISDAASRIERLTSSALVPATSKAKGSE